MKRIKLFMPLAVATTAITPVTMITSCGKANITIEKKELSSGDSLVGYTFKMAKIPSDKKVTVNVINKSESKEQVQLYRPYENNGEPSTLDLNVKDDGTVVVPAGYYLAPSQSASSEFGINFSYKDGDKTVSETVDGLKFNYVVDYGAELANTPYPAQEAKSQWGSDVPAEYTTDFLANTNIFQNDARYSTSQKITEAVAAGKITGLSSFKAYFNDIVQEGDGVHLHMNYEVKGDNNSHFEFTMPGGYTYQYDNFNFSFTFETSNGYKMSLTAPTNENADYQTFYVVDESKHYSLEGRFQGSFDCIEGAKEQVHVEYNGKINNTDMFPTNGDAGGDQMAAMLSFGIIQLTYDFGWATQIPQLKILSPYAKNSVQ